MFGVNGDSRDPLGRLKVNNDTYQRPHVTIIACYKTGGKYVNQYVLCTKKFPILLKFRERLYNAATRNIMNLCTTAM